MIPDTCTTSFSVGGLLSDDMIECCAFLRLPFYLFTYSQFFSQVTLKFLVWLFYLLLYTPSSCLESGEPDGLNAWWLVSCMPLCLSLMTITSVFYYCLIYMFLYSNGGMDGTGCSLLFLAVHFAACLSILLMAYAIEWWEAGWLTVLVSQFQ